VIIASGCAAVTLSLFITCGSEPNPPGEKNLPSNDPKSADGRVVIRFGVGLYSDSHLTHSGYQPLMDFLSRNTPYRVELRLGRDTERTEVDVNSADLETYLEERIVEVAPLGVLSYLLVERKFGAIPLVKPLNHRGEPTARSVFLCRSDNPISGLDDLEGRRLALGPAHSTLGYVIPRFELVKSGIELGALESIQILPDDESVIEALLEGRFEVGAVSELLSRRVNSEDLRVLHVSEPIPTRPLAVRGDLPTVVADSLRKGFLKLDSNSAPQREGWDEEFRYGFTPADASDYDPVRSILKASGAGCAKGCHENTRF
jgi:phosphonate transport system substrate-binding protein